MDVLKLNESLDKVCKQAKAVGVNVALFNGKEIIYNYNFGFANREKRIKSNNDSLYMIGSNTKLLTALGILKLMEDGKLSLEDDVRKHIPEFSVKSYFEYDKITIENLLMHRSGLVSDLFTLILDRTRDYHEVVSELKETYLTEKPGKMFAYSNVGYTVLGIIIERISGLSYPEYIQKEIADPLGIEVYFFSNEKDRKPFESTVSLSYDKKGKQVEDRVSTLLPAGSNVYMSLNDFVKFGQMFLNKNSAVLKRETLELMEVLNLDDSVDKEVYNVGYGLIHNQYDMGKTVGKVLGHGGNTTCHHSIFNYIPEFDVGVVVMTNSQRAIALSQMAGMTALSAYLQAKGIDTGKIKAENEHSKCDKVSLHGRYATALGIMDIHKNHKNELVTKVSNIPIKLRLCEDGYFQACPIKTLHKLPMFKRQIRGMRFKPATYLGEEILLVEQNGKYHKTKGIIGCRYEETEINENFAKACGKYQVENENFKDFECKCCLEIKEGTLILEIAALNVKIKSCLKVIDDNIAIVQGFGRLTRQTVELKSQDGADYMTFSGMVFKKM